MPVQGKVRENSGEGSFRCRRANRLKLGYGSETQTEPSPADSLRSVPQDNWSWEESGSCCSRSILKLKMCSIQCLLLVNLWSTWQPYMRKFWWAELAMPLCVFCVVCCTLCVLLVCSVWVLVLVLVCHAEHPLSSPPPPPPLSPCVRLRTPPVWSQTWSTGSTTTTSRKPLRWSLKSSRWKRMYLLLRADQRLKQKPRWRTSACSSTRTVPIRERNMDWYWTRNAIQSCIPSGKKDWILFFVMVIYLEKKMDRLNSGD